MTKEKRSAGTVLFDAGLKEAIKVAAKKDKRSYNGFIEVVMAKAIGYKE